MADYGADLLRRNVYCVIYLGLLKAVYSHRNSQIHSTIYIKFYRNLSTAKGCIHSVLRKVALKMDDTK
jgi:hypothetical protein